MTIEERNLRDVVRRILGETKNEERINPSWIATAASSSTQTMAPRRQQQQDDADSCVEDRANNSDHDVTDSPPTGLILEQSRN